MSRSFLRSPAGIYMFKVNKRHQNDAIGTVSANEKHMNPFLIVFPLPINKGFLVFWKGYEVGVFSKGYEVGE